MSLSLFTSGRGHLISIAFLGAVYAVPTSLGPLWVGQYNDVSLEGSGLTLANQVIASADATCTGTVLGPPAIVHSVLHFYGVEGLPASGYICWCPGSHPCAERVSFPFTLGGPSGALLDLSVVVGESFDVDIAGTQLTDTDRLLFATECGKEGANWGKLVQDKPSMRFGQRFDAYLTGKPTLMMCWCPGIRGCDNHTMHSVHVGNVSAVGPDFGQVIQATAGFAFSMVLNTTIATASDFFRITEKGACGPHHTDKLAFKVCDRTTCYYRNDGSPDTFNATMEQWGNLMLSEKGEYSICWCHDSTYDPNTGETYSAACRSSTPSAFTAEVGIVQVAGIDPIHVVCDAWKACKFTYGKVGDGVVVVAEDDVCDGTKLISTDIIYYHSNGEFSLPSSPPGTRKLCYCDIDLLGYCDHGSAYRLVLGTVLTEGDMIVTSSNLMQCNRGECSVEMLGIAFHADDLITLADSCPSAPSDPVLRVTHFTHESAVFSANGPFEAGAYRLCLCSYQQSTDSCASLFPHFLGDAIVVSATVGDEKVQCRVGLPCVIAFSSIFPIKNGDAVSIDAEGFGDQPIVISGITNDTTYNFTVTTDVLTVAEVPATYEISYCSTLGVIRGVETNCANGEGFNVIGEVEVSSSLISPLSFINPTPQAVTVMVESPDADGVIYCAASSTNQSSVPNTAELANMEIANPVGAGVLRTSKQGENFVHIDLRDSFTNDDIGDEIRVWCIRDANCAHMRCALPHNIEGARTHIRNVGASAPDQLGVSGDSIEVTVTGSLEPDSKMRITGGDWIDCVGDATGCKSTLPYLMSGIHSVEFCDRFDYAICSIAIPISKVVIMGVYAESLIMPSIIQPETPRTVNIHGIGMDQLTDLQSCYENSTMELTLISSDFTTSVWTLVPGDEGAYDQLCFYTGEDRVDEGNEFIVETFQDCVVGEWEWQSDCSVTCGQGTRVRKRPILVKSIGRGTACPDVEEATSCGDPCVGVFFLGAHVLDGDSVTVDAPFKIDVFAENLEDTDRIIIVSRSEACGGYAKVTSGASCEVSAPNHLLCGGGPADLRIHTPGIYRACFCDASARAGCKEAASYDMDLELFILVQEKTVEPDDTTTMPTWGIILISVGGTLAGLCIVYMLVKRNRTPINDVYYGNQTSPVDDSIAQEVLREVWKSYNRLDHWKENEENPVVPQTTSKTFLDMPLNPKENANSSSMTQRSGWTNSTGCTVDPSKQDSSSPRGLSKFSVEIGSPPQADSPSFWVDNGNGDAASDGFLLGESASQCSSPESRRSLRTIRTNMFGADSTSGTNVPCFGGSGVFDDDELGSPADEGQGIGISPDDAENDGVSCDVNATAENSEQDPEKDKSDDAPPEVVSELTESPPKGVRFDNAASSEPSSVVGKTADGGGEASDSQPKAGKRAAKPPPLFKFKRVGGAARAQPSRAAARSTEADASSSGQKPIEDSENGRGDSPCGETSVTLQASLFSAETLRGSPRVTSKSLPESECSGAQKHDGESGSRNSPKLALDQVPAPSYMITTAPPPFRPSVMNDRDAMPPSMLSNPLPPRSLPTIPSFPSGAKAPAFPKPAGPTSLDELPASRLEELPVAAAGDASSSKVPDRGPATCRLQGAGREEADEAIPPNAARILPETALSEAVEPGEALESSAACRIPNSEPVDRHLRMSENSHQEPTSDDQQPVSLPKVPPDNRSPNIVPPSDPMPNDTRETALPTLPEPRSPPSGEENSPSQARVAPPPRATEDRGRMGPTGDQRGRASSSSKDPPPNQRPPNRSGAAANPSYKLHSPPVYVAEPTSSPPRLSLRGARDPGTRPMDNAPHASASSTASPPGERTPPPPPPPQAGKFKVMPMPGRVIPRAPVAPQAPRVSQDYAQQRMPGPDLSPGPRLSAPEHEVIASQREPDPHGESSNPPRGLSLGGRHGIGNKPAAKPPAAPFRRQFGASQREYGDSAPVLGKKSTGKYKANNDSDED